MSNEVAIRAGSVLLDPSRFHQAVELAKVMAKADCMPAHLKGKPADCLRVVELAYRANQSPYAIADKTYFVQGKIAFEGQLCAALVNAHPSIDRRLSYEYQGDEDKPSTLKLTVSAKLRDEDKPRTVDVTWIQGEAQSKGAKEKWKYQPAQQLAYYGARVWARRHTPEILLGMYTADELETGHIGPDHAREINPVQSFGVARFATPAPQVIDVDLPAHDLETGEIREEPQPPPSEHAESRPPAAMAAAGPAPGTQKARAQEIADELRAAGPALAKVWMDRWPEIEKMPQKIRHRLDAIRDELMGPLDHPMAELDHLEDESFRLAGERGAQGGLDLP